jgi:hypothetical protein
VIITRDLELGHGRSGDRDNHMCHRVVEREVLAGYRY